MEIERLKKAFIAADDAGDTESASMFAAKIRELQSTPTPEKSFGDKVLQNVAGVGAGILDLARGMVLDMPMSVGMQVGGMFSGEDPSIARKSSKMAMEDVTSGIKASDFSQEATEAPSYKAMMYPFEKLSEGIEWLGDRAGEITGNKEIGEASKIGLDIVGAVAPLPGAHYAGKAIKRGMEKFKNRDSKIPELDPETVVGKPQPEPKQYMGPLFENLKDVDTSDVRNPYRDNIQPDMFDSHLELQQLDENRRAPEGYEQALEADRPLKFDEPSLQPLKDPMQEASPQSEFRFGEDPPLKSPQELALDYDPFSLKQPENMAMDPQRKALDIDLLPERVSLDTVVKGQITKYNRLLEEHNRLMDEARTQGLEGTRIKYQELGKTKKAKEQIDAQAARLETIQKQMDNLAKQLQRRMEVKHNFLYDEAWPKNKLYSGTERVNKFDEKGNQIFDTKTDSKSVQGKGKRFKYEVPAQEDTTGVYSEFPPSVEGPAEITTGLTVEKMERPDMQRSPDANITGGEVVKKTFVPKGQAGKLDVSVFGEGIGKLLKGAKAIGKRLVGPDPYKPKNLKLSHEDKIRKITGADARDIPTFVKEVLANKDNLVDIPKNMSLKGIIRKDLTPSAVGRLSYENNPIISYVNNRLNRIDGAIKAAKETALWGKGFGTNLRGKPVKGKSDDGARTIMKTIPAARREGFRAAVNKYMDGKILEERGLPDPTDSMLQADGLNAREIQAYRAARKQMDTVVDKVNESLVAAGQKPIPKKPGYFPAIWMGDYRVFVKNAKGETVKTLAFDHQFQVDLIKEEIKKLDPSLKVDFTDASKNKYNVNDLSAFQLASEVFQHDPKLSKLLDAARSDILQHRGYKKHGLQKKGVEGYLGSEKGGFADMEQAIDIYLEQAYNFLGDQEKRATVGKLNEEFQKNGYTVSKELPNTSQYVNDIVANSIGSVESHLKLVDNFFAGIGEFTGEHFGIGGKSSAKKFNKMLNGIAGFYNLATAKQLAINAVQPIYSLAKAQQLKVEINTKNVTLNLAKAYKDAFLHESVSKMSPESRKALEFARKSGLIDARTLELINANTGQAASNTLKTFGHGAAWWEQEAVRVPAYLFYDHMLRDVIKNPEARWEAAAQLTEHTMVNYSKTQTPAIYAQAGLVGDSLRPYQQFTHNYHGQFLEYMQLAKRQKEFRPLATFLAAQATLGGIRGLVPLSAVGGLIALYNMVPGVDPVPTPEEYLMGSGMSDDYVFGPLSKVTGANLSGSAGAPNILPIPGVPGLSWGSTFATDAIGGGIKMMAGMDEESDRMKALLAISPSAAKGWVEELFQDEQGRIPNPNRGMQPDVDLERTDREWFTKKWIGAEPLREGAQKARIRASESEQKKVEEKRKQLFDKFVDDFVSKGEFNSEILGEYIERGGDPDGLSSSIKSAMEKKMLSRVQDALLSKKDLSQAQYLQLMEKYQLEISQMELKDLMELNSQ